MDAQAHSHFLKNNLGKQVVLCEHCKDDVIKRMNIKNMYVADHEAPGTCEQCSSGTVCLYQVRLRKPKLRILRGIPGAGKTTIVAELLIPFGWKHVSADQYFVGPDGWYKFVPDEIQDAHDWCFRAARRYLSAGHDVVVDNTNRLISEFARYTEMKDLDFTLEVRRVVGDYGSTKNIPENIMDRHRSGYQPYPGEIEIRSRFDEKGNLLIQERKR